MVSHVGVRVVNVSRGSMLVLHKNRQQRQVQLRHCSTDTVTKPLPCCLWFITSGRCVDPVSVAAPMSTLRSESLKLPVSWACGHVVAMLSWGLSDPPASSHHLMVHPLMHVRPVVRYSFQHCNGGGLLGPILLWHSRWGCRCVLATPLQEAAPKAGGTSPARRPFAREI